MSEFLPPLSPSDAPFVAGTVPAGWGRPLTTEEAANGNLLYPVPPYGQTYNPPGPPPTPYPPVVQNVKFVKLTDVVNGLETQFTVSTPDTVDVDDIIVMWPIECVAGVADDVGVRPVRVLDKVGDVLTVNYDSTGIDTSGMVLVAIKYVGP